MAERPKGFSTHVLILYIAVGIIILNLFLWQYGNWTSKKPSEVVMSKESYDRISSVLDKLSKLPTDVAVPTKSGLPAGGSEFLVLKETEKAKTQEPKAPGFRRSDAIDISLKILAETDHLKQEVPKLIHQVVGLFNDKPAHLWDSVNSFKSKNPSWTHILWNATDVDVLVSQYFPFLEKLFNRFKLPVLKADTVRYLILYIFGGVYSDIDTLCIKPIEAWSEGRQGVAAIVGVEADGKDLPEWHKAYKRQLQICQWTMVSTPGHPIFARTIYNITQRMTHYYIPVEKVHRDEVCELTGPGVFSDAVYAHIAEHGHRWQEFLGLSQAAQIDDLFLLSITGFSPGVGHMGAGYLGDPRACVQHMFKGTWTQQSARRQLMAVPAAAAA